LAASTKCSIEEIGHLLPLHRQQLGDVFLIVSVTERLGSKEHLIGTVTQQNLVKMSKLTGHRPTLILGKNFLSQDDESFARKLDVERFDSKFHLFLFNDGILCHIVGRNFI